MFYKRKAIPSQFFIFTIEYYKMNMKNILLFTTVLLLCVSSVHSQSLNNLKEKNGFKNIKLGNSINDYLNYGFQELEREHYKGSHKLYKWDSNGNSTLSNIGEYNVSMIFVRTIKGVIYRIEVIVDNEGVFDVLQNAFGYIKPNYPNLWEIDGISCQWMPHNNKSAIIYSNHKIEAEAKNYQKTRSEKGAVDEL